MASIGRHRFWHLSAEILKDKLKTSGGVWGIFARKGPPNGVPAKFFAL